MAESRRALSLKQPWAELVMLGKKRIEYRSQQCYLRGRVYIYASQGRLPKQDEADLAEEIGIDIGQLPRGVLVGTVEIYDCVESDEYRDTWEWKFRKPIRAQRKIKPTGFPQPGWFWPFKK